MSTDASPLQKKMVQMWVWAPTVLMVVVLPRLMEWLNVSQWFLTIPAAAVGGSVVVYALVNRRRVAAREAAIRG